MPFPHTHFRFTDLGERAITKVNGVVASIGIWYNQGLPITSHKANNAHFGEPYDKIKYQVTDGTLTSNEATVNVNFPPNKLLAPTSSDVIVSMLNSATLNVGALITYNAAVDRIKIISFDNAVGELEFFGSATYNNKVIMQYELDELKFNSLTGFGSPYQKIYFKVGNADGFSATTYSVTINIIGEASLLNLFRNDSTPAEDLVNGYKGTEVTLRVSNGYVNGTAKVRMDINLDAAAWPPLTSNQAFLSYNGGNFDTNENGINEFDIALNAIGETDLIFTIGISLDDIPVTGTITFTLLEINGDAGLVSATDEQIIDIDY